MLLGVLFGKDIVKLLKLHEKAIEDGIDNDQFVEQAASHFKIDPEKVKLVTQHYAVPTWTYNRKVLFDMPVGYDKSGRVPFFDDAKA